VQALEPFELPEGHGGSRPAIAVAGETVAVSDPAAKRLVLVDAHDWAVAGEVALTKAPMSVVATGLDPLAGEDHDHEH
jgi:hypothetical protein